jgi:hypothetical protein
MERHRHASSSLAHQGGSGWRSAGPAYLSRIIAQDDDIETWNGLHIQRGGSPGGSTPGSAGSKPATPGTPVQHGGHHQKVHGGKRALVVNKYPTLLAASRKIAPALRRRRLWRKLQAASTMIGKLGGKTASRLPQRTDICYHCRQPGHFKDKCPYVQLPESEARKQAAAEAAAAAVSHSCACIGSPCLRHCVHGAPIGGGGGGGSHRSAGWR